MAPLLNARLDHFCLQSPDPEALAGFYARVFDMALERRTDCCIAFGPQRKLVFQKGVKGSIGYCAYAFADHAALAAYRDRLEHDGLALEASPSPLMSKDAFAVKDPDGARVVFGVSMTPFSYMAQPARMAARLQHFVTATDDIDPLTAFYRDRLHFRVADEVRDEKSALRAVFLRTDEEHHSRAIFLADRKRLDHHCYELADWNALRDWGDRMADNHVPLRWGPGRHGPGHNLFFMIHDPDGNWVELSAELDLLPDDAPMGQWKHEERTLNSWGQAFLRS